jgi:hypothetical protein
MTPHPFGDDFETRLNFCDPPVFWNQSSENSIMAGKVTLPDFQEMSIRVRGGKVEVRHRYFSHLRNSLLSNVTLSRPKI